MSAACIGAGAPAFQARDLRRHGASRAVVEDDDGVHGGRMKPLASLNTATPAGVTVSRRRKPLEPLVRCHSLPAECSLTDAKENLVPTMETRGIKRKAAQENFREAKVRTVGNEKMDLLFMALDRAGESSSDQTVDKVCESENAKPPYEAVKKWKQFCRLRSSLKRAAEGTKTAVRQSEEQERERPEDFKPGIMSRVRDGKEVIATIGAVVGASQASVDPPKQEACSPEDPDPILATAAVRVAARWLDLLHLDLKGRLAALKRSRKRVRGVILSAQCGRGIQRPGQQRNDEDKWMRMFMNMDADLAGECSKLEASLKQVQEMQKFCEPVGPESDDVHVSHTQQSSSSWLFGHPVSRERALAATAASICSTANFSLKPDGVVH